MHTFNFKQVDVFSPVPLKGNPLAVVFGADKLSDERMAAFATWTNLSETTFILEPQDPRADYRVRIFTTLKELPFAGHPTLGTCHAWLEAGGVPKGEEIIQECGVGLVRVRRQGAELAFLAPPLLRTGPVDASLMARVQLGLGLEPEAIVRAQWVDNGAGWLAVMLADRQQVLALQPDHAPWVSSRRGIRSAMAMTRSSKSGPSFPVTACLKIRPRAASTPGLPNGCSAKGWRLLAMWSAKA
jgi:PhzF family phenazine biosynthesis protein